MTAATTSKLSSFATEVMEGLASEPRTLSSKWFYDERGTQLFKEIMTCPEYYLTQAEAEIYETYVTDFLAATDGQPFELIELGAGDGSKTQILLDYFYKNDARFTYRPIDLSSSALAELGDLVKLRWPRLEYKPIQADYFEALDRLGGRGNRQRRLVLFPGANVGNFTPADAVAMLTKIRGFLTPGDLLLTGFDLKKDPAVVLAAYNDAAGVTANFNLNLLSRINRELGGNFELDCWRHWQSYDPVSGAACSYLVPIEPQTVSLGAAGRTYQFRAWDPIQVEISQKYHLREIEGMAEAAGYEFVRHFSDGREWFTNSLWRVPRG